MTIWPMRAGRRRQELARLRLGSQSLWSAPHFDRTGGIADKAEACAYEYDYVQEFR